MEISKRIKALRESLDMSQQELAELVGYKTASAINKIELGLRSVSSKKLNAFARALHTTPDYLMGFTDDVHERLKRFSPDDIENNDFSNDDKGLLSFRINGSDEDIAKVEQFLKSSSFRYTRDDDSDIHDSNDKERELISDFESLSEEDKKKAIEYIKLLKKAAE